MVIIIRLNSKPISHRFKLPTSELPIIRTRRRLWFSSNRSSNLNLNSNTIKGSSSSNNNQLGIMIKAPSYSDNLLHSIKHQPSSSRYNNRSQRMLQQFSFRVKFKTLLLLRISKPASPAVWSTTQDLIQTLQTKDTPKMNSLTQLQLKSN